ncbi:hypothetical protein QTP88_027634 [Uroleucon formosanum]
MSNIVAVKSSTDVDTQSDTEIMIHVFDDLRENRSKRLEERDVVSFQLHKRYKSLPKIALLSTSAGEAPQPTTELMNQVFTDLRENRLIAVEISGDKGSIIKTEITQLHQKNKGFQIIEQIGLIISGNNEIQLPENFNPCSVATMKYTPLTSVDVERSFSLYKHILSDRRTNTTPEHMEKYIIVNSFYKN